MAFASALLESGKSGEATEMLLAAAAGEQLPRIPQPWRAHYFELLTRSWIASGRPAEAVAGRVGLAIATAMADRAAGAALAAGDVATAADQAGAPVEAARARTLAGQALAAAGEPEWAIAELEGAARQLEACGARRYRQEAEHELRKLGRRFSRRTRPRDPDGQGVDTLTERELEVARLVVDRHTNPEIARALFLSEKTIETHLHNIFRKLGVSSRADVARTLERAEA